MKDPINLGVRRAWILYGAVCAFLLTVPAIQSRADTLSQNNSIVTLDLSGAGMTSWKVGGQEQLGQQSYWYGIGNGPEAPISAISAPAVSGVVPPLGKLTVSYANLDYSVKVAYVLTGGNSGSGRSSLSQQITIANTTANSLDFHFFQYSDFNLLNTASGQSIDLFSGPSTAIQVAGPFGLTNGVTPSVSHREAATDGHILASLVAGGPTTLIDNSGIAAGPGNANYAFEWDFIIDPNSTADIISSLTQIQVPEPAIPALIILGLAGLTIRRRCRI